MSSYCSKIYVCIPIARILIDLQADKQTDRHAANVLIDPLSIRAEGTTYLRPYSFRYTLVLVVRI